MKNKKRLIDIEQAKRATYEEVFWSESEQAVVRHFLEKLPTVDAVEVVRCKECKHSCYDTLGDCYWCDEEHLVSADNFCGYGEKVC